MSYLDSLAGRAAACDRAGYRGLDRGGLGLAHDGVVSASNRADHSNGRWLALDASGCNSVSTVGGSWFAGGARRGAALG